MKILCLYNNDIALELFAWIESQGHEVVIVSDKITEEWCSMMCFSLTVSYTYRYILSADILDALNNNVVNIHNSYLPFNRGADPNIWSMLDNTPRGVTIHYMSPEIDKGDIIAQVLMPPTSDEATLRGTYYELDSAAKELFKTAFSYYDKWQDMRKKPQGTGTYHRKNESKTIKEMIDESGGYQISTQKLKELVSRMG